jgi:hypothetical protein
MLKPLSKTCITILMMFAFIGQSMAYHTSFSLKLSAETDIVNEHVLQQQHSTNADSDCQVTNCCDTNCCELGCVCPANACTSVLSILNEPKNNDFYHGNEHVYSYTNKQPMSIISLPFRPPIFTSN